MKEIKDHALTILFLLSSLSLCAQTESKSTLKEVLDSLENRFDVIFTYLDENIDGVEIEAPEPNSDLNQVLSALQDQTNLLFIRLDERYVSISIPDEGEAKLIPKICGHLKDEESGIPLAGATVQSRHLFTITDSEGYFELENIPSNTMITFRFLGFNVKNINALELQPTGCPDIPMIPKPVALSEVIIPDFLTLGINKRSDGSFALNTRAMGILPGLTEPDLMHSIQTLPGIQSINETVTNINIRGGSNDQNLVLWDGIRMYQSGHFFGLISVFNPYLTKEVHLIKNGTEAYLGDGVSSTISIETEDNPAQSLSGGGGVNLLHADAFINVPLSKKASFSVSGRRSIGDLLKTPTYDKYFSRAFRDTEIFNSSPGADSLSTTNQSFNFYDFNFNFNYKISPKDKFKLSLINIGNHLEFQENALINNITESKTSTLKQQSLGGQLSIGHLWSPKARSSANLYFSSYDLDAVNVNLFENQRLLQQNKVLDIGFKVDSRFTFSSTSDLFIGYQLSEVGITNLDDINNPSFRRLEKNVLVTHAGFAEINMNSRSNNTRMRAGIRTNYFDKFGKWRVEPRLSFTQKIYGPFSFELLAELKSQATSQIIDFQTDFLGVEKRRWVLANEQDIPVIRAKQASVGILYHKENLLVSLEGYLKEVGDISSISQGFQNQFQFVRAVGSYQTWGIDLLFSKKFSNLDSWVSYSYAKNTFNFQELVPPTFPNNLDIPHTITAGSSYHNTSWQFSVGLHWHTGKPFTEISPAEPVIDNEINFVMPNAGRVRDYLRIDFSSTYSFRLGNYVRAQIGASFWNIFNQTNIINASYILDNNNLPNLIEKQALLFTPNVMLRIIF